MAQARARLNLGCLPARNCESVKGAGNHMQLHGHPGTDEAASIFQVFLEKQIEGADGYECWGQAGWRRI